MTVPTRKPRCLKHPYHLASCEDCQAVMHAERQAAAERLDRAAR